MQIAVLALAALLAQADAGTAQDATAARPTAAQLERRHLELVHQIMLLRTRLPAAKDRPALDQQIDALTAELDGIPAQVAQAQASEGHARTVALQAKFDAADALSAERAADPVYAVPALSAAVCNARALRSDATETIRQERLYSRKGGGVVDLRRIHDAQEIMREADQRERAAKGALRRFKRPALPCKGRVLEIADCVEDKHRDGCDALGDYLAAYEGLAR